MTTRCQRSWEVEAARDGRLTGEALESYELHLASCPSCAKDAKSLEELARGLRAIETPAADGASMSLLRNRVLAAVDAEQTGRSGSSRRGPVVAFSLAFAAALAGIFFAASWRTPRSDNRTTGPTLALTPAPAHVETTVDVTATDGARFTRTTEAEVERFDLVDGTLRLRVRRGAGGRRVVIRVPDGEIEDVGTVFEVKVAQGHTEGVRVEEGRVAVRLRNAPTVNVDAGGAWNRPVTAAVAPTSAPTAMASPNARVSLTANANANANANAEDVAYLEVLQLLRDGHDAEARAAASRYLRAFPTGFRRDEMQRVAAELPR